MSEDFYIGYLPQAPAGLARRTKRTAIALICLAMLLAVVLVLAQNPFTASAFEFGNNRNFEGTITLDPYPSLLVTRQGADQAAPYSRYLLVAPGKHGAGNLVSQFDGMRVKLDGQLIYRDANTMIEVVPGSISVLEKAPAPSTTVKDLGEATLTGEIVDTKCYLGVMNPGNGKVHRDCAARCISGGIPVGFVVHGNGQVYLLTAKGGQPLSRKIIGKVAEPITLSGKVLRIGDTRFFEVERFRQSD
jgi:hypothetical protein